MFTIISPRTVVLSGSSFNFSLTASRSAVWGGPGPRSAASGRSCSLLRRPGGRRGRGGVVSGPAAPLPLPRAPRPRPSQAPRAALTPAAAGTAPPPGTALPVSLRTLGFGFPGGRRLRGGGPQGPPPGKEGKQTWGADESQEQLPLRGSGGELGPGRPMSALRADKAGYASPFSQAGKRPAQPRPRESHDHPCFGGRGAPPPASGPMGAEPRCRGGARGRLRSRPSAVRGGAGREPGSAREPAGSWAEGRPPLPLCLRRNNVDYITVSDSCALSSKQLKEDSSQK